MGVGCSGTGARLTVICVAMVILAGCTGVNTLSYAPPNPQATAPTVTSPPPALPPGIGVILPPVPGATTTTVPVATGGTAIIGGNVVGPTGVVAGATVQAERIVGARVATVMGTTKADGTFVLPGLLGGDYRVRAWMSPTLDLTAPLIFYLAGGEDHEVSLPLTSIGGIGVVGVMNPDPPTLNQPAALAVQVTGPAVGPDGVMRQPLVAGAIVELTNGPAWLVLTGNPLTTASDGEATFEVSCVSAGDQPLDASVNGQVPQALTLPSCQLPPPPTTIPPPTLPSTTSTSRPITGGTGTTSSTVSQSPPGT